MHLLTSEETGASKRFQVYKNTSAPMHGHSPKVYLKKQAWRFFPHDMQTLVPVEDIFATLCIAPAALMAVFAQSVTTHRQSLLRALRSSLQMHTSQDVAARLKDFVYQLSCAVAIQTLIAAPDIDSVDLPPRTTHKS